jgi:SAM-dependent methyltransferase
MLGWPAWAMEKQKDFRLGKRARTAVLGALVAACGPNTSAPGTPSHEAKHEHGHGAKGHHHRFDDAARWAKVFDDPARDEWQRPARVVEVMTIRPGMTVADVGAGTGYFAPYLSKTVGPSGKVIAEDVEPDMVKWLADRAKREGLSNVEVLLGAEGEPHLPMGAVDRILLVDAWHHVADRTAFAKKLVAALKPAGAVYIVDFTLDSPHGPPKPARLPPEVAMSDLSSAGLEAAVIEDAGLPYQYIVRGRLNR